MDNHAAGGQNRRQWEALQLCKKETNVRFNRIVNSIVVVGWVTLVGAASAQDAASEKAGGKTALTIYSSAQPGAIRPDMYTGPGHFGGELPGYAMIRQERDIELTSGRSTIRFSDVAALIDPTTVTFSSLTDPQNTRVLEQNYQFDLVSADKLMERYLDRKVTIEQLAGEKVQTFTGTLLSTSGGAILKTEAGQVQVVRQYANAIFPELPGGLITKPTLVWEVTAAKPGVHQTRVTYQTNGITWWSDYNVIFTEGADANSGVLDVGAWVSIINQSGAGYADAKLKLIAGEVHRAPVPGPVPHRGAKVLEMPVSVPEDAGFEEKAFFEYHLYTLGRPTTLPDNSTKQIELFPMAKAVPCEKVMVYYGLEPAFRGIFGSPMTDRNFGVQSNKKIDIYLRFKNEEQIGLGIPLPAGRIRVSKMDTADGSLEFIGEDTIDHTPKNEELLLKLGTAFDLVGERVQTDYQVDTRRETMDETIVIKLRNHKKEPVKVIAKENLYRWSNWEIRQSSHKYEKIDSRTVHFPVMLEPDKEQTITYQVHYSW